MRALRGEAFDEVELVLRNKVLVDILEEPVHTDSGERWLHTKKIPILDPTGEPQYLLGISSDITEQRHAAAAGAERSQQGRPLPIVDGALEPAQAPAAPVVVRGKETILLVEDEDLLRPLIRQILEMNGYTLLEAKHGLEALTIAGEHRGRIDLVVTDLVMPQMGGFELVRRVSRHHPEMKVLYISGYTERAGLHQEGLPVGASFLQKPFTPKALANKVREVLDR